MIPDDPARARELRTMKLRATGLLVAVSIVYVAVLVVWGDEGWAGYVTTASEAAMVGGLADWFAVTALFRHPLRLPIPHTAIIPKRKDQIGSSLGDFVQDNFLDADTIRERIESAGLGQRLGDWLVEPENSAKVAEQGAAVVRGLTDVLNDDEVQAGIEAVVVEKVEGLPIARLGGQMLDFVVEGDHHQVVFDAALIGIGNMIEENQVTLRERIYKESPWWVPEPIDDRVFDKITGALGRFIDDVGHDQSHDLRKNLDRKVRELAGRLKESPELAQRADELRAEVLDHPEVRAWTANLWANIKEALVTATSDPESEVRQRIETAVLDAGRRLQADPELQAKIEGWVGATTGYLANQTKGEVANIISSTVEGWDAEETSERIELQVGRDLQFIRINGTVVGGLAGLVIHAVTQLLL